MRNMQQTFNVRQARGRRLAALTVATGPELADCELPESTKQRLVESLAEASAKHGFAIDSDVVIDIQENWLSGGVDVTVAGFVLMARNRRPASLAPKMARAS
jgi:hypothetical protein